MQKYNTNNITCIENVEVIKYINICWNVIQAAHVNISRDIEEAKI